MNKSFAIAPVRIGMVLVLAMLSLSACTGSTTTTDNAPGAEESSAEKSSTEKSSTEKSGTEESSAESTTPTTDRPYINSLLPEAQRIQSEYGIPVDLTLAIAIQETGWGKAEIGQNNHFGLRCASDDCITLNKGGKSIRYETCPDESECFNLFAESINELSGNDPGNVRKLYQNGYATSPRWAGKVRKIRRQVRKTLKASDIALTD